MEFGHPPIMKFLFPIAVIFFSFGLCAFAAPETGPLNVNPPAGWSMKYQREKGVQLYSLTRPPQEGFVLLMFSHSPYNGNRDQISGYIDSMAKGYPEQIKKNPMLKLESYTKGKFTGVTFSGEFVVFTMAGGGKQVMFMFSDGDGAWTGQYAGPSERWLEALEILKAVKKNG